MILLIPSLLWAESRKVIVVVDTGLHISQISAPYMCNLTHLSSLGSKSKIWSQNELSGSQPLHEVHGSNIIGLIGSSINTKKYCILSIQYSNGEVSNYKKALKLLRGVDNIAAVNLSISGLEALPLETDTIINLLNRGVKVFCAAGNRKTRLRPGKCNAYPACLKLREPFKSNKNFIVVSALDVPTANKTSHFEIKTASGRLQGNPPLSGTSQATAIQTGKEFSKNKLLKGDK